MRKIFKSSTKNPRHLDEMPKNYPSKTVTSLCSVGVEWLQEPGSFGGHHTHNWGHRMVSGIVRRNLKKETQKMITEELESIDNDGEENSD